MVNGRRRICSGLGLLCIGVAAAFLPAVAWGRASRGLSAYDGAWMVSSAGACTGLGSGQVTIMNGRIIGPNGAGRVSASGIVRTIQTINGVTVTGQGRIVGAMGSGSFQQSDGCTGTWTAVKM